MNATGRVSNGIGQPVRRKGISAFSPAGVAMSTISL